ncbi:MAG TPA: alcohol dehydrogenase, partial [Thalassospira lucentensis]
ARADMLAAASMGATAFQKGLGGVHALAHPVGAIFDTHHGLTNAILLPYVMQANRRAIEEKCKVVCRLLDLASPGFDTLFEWVMAFRSRLGVVNTLAEIGVDVDRADEVAVKAKGDPSDGGNPIELSVADYTAIFRRACVGDLG